MNRKKKSDLQLREGDYQMGVIIIATLKSGMKGVLFEEGILIDIGTPGDLQLASKFLNNY